MRIKYEMIHGIYDIPLKIYDTDNAVGYVIAVHGFGGDKESSAIESLAKRMTARSYAVIAFDFPAHGTSKADDYFCLSNSRFDLETVLRYAEGRYPDAGRKAIFATSFGGYVTLLSLDKLPADMRIVLRAPAVDMKASFEKMLPVTHDEYKKAGFVEMGFERKFNVPYSFYTELCENDISQTDMQRDILIIHGSQDNIVQPEYIQRFCKANPKAKLEVIEGADYRFKKKGELDMAVSMAEKYITE